MTDRPPSSTASTWCSPALADSLSTLFRHRALLRALTSRELRARYRGSALGFMWSFLNPLLLLAVYTFVFGFVFGPRLGAGPEPYGLFLFTGLLPWAWFSSSLLEGSATILGGGSLLKKVVFPAEVLPLVSVLSNAVQFLLALPVLLLVLVLFGRMPGLVAVTAIPLLLIQFLFTSGLTLGLAALTVLFRDVRDILAHIVTLWFFATPIIYEVSALPRVLQPLMRFNPMAQIVRGWQDTLFFNRAASATGLLGAAIVSVIVAAVGYMLFDRLREVFPEEV